MFGACVSLYSYYLYCESIGPPLPPPPGAVRTVRLSLWDADPNAARLETHSCHIAEAFHSRLQWSG